MDQATSTLETPQSTPDESAFTGIDSLTEADLQAAISNPASFGDLLNREIQHSEADAAELPDAESEQAEQPQAETNDSTQSDATSDPEPSTAPNRVRIGFLDSTEQARINSALQISRAEQISFQEAFLRVSGKSIAQPDAPATATTEAQPADAPDPTEARLIELRSALRQARTDFNEDAEFEILEQIADVKAEQRANKMFSEREAVEQEKAQAVSYMDTYNESFDEAIALFPEAANLNSELGQAVKAELDRREAVNPSLKNDPTYLLDVIPRIAIQMGYAPRTSAAATAATAGAQLSTRQPSRPARPAAPELAGASAASSNATMDRQTAIAQVDAMDFEQLVALAHAVGSKPTTR
jgi:hypothetical protein